MRDTVLAVAAFAASVGALAGRGQAGAGTRDLDPLGVLLAAAATLPLVAWRRAPLAVFVISAGASSALNALGYPPGPPVGPTIAVFLLALAPDRTRVPRWASAAVVVGLLFVHAGALGIAEHAFPTVGLLVGALVWGGAWVAGDRVRQRRTRLAEVEERTRRAERDAERERRLAAAEERTRIARDLHDSAGHAINVILVQAGAARLLSKQDPDRSQEALETIEEVARETLGEIDQLVRALREDKDGGRVEPPLGLAALGTLAQLHRSAGLAVRIRESGERRPLSPGLDQAAYRIVQEALTNAARHGDGSADVEIGFGPTRLELTVTNPAPVGAVPADGHGIVGMRERATLLGGSLDAAAGDGRFVVRAHLPYGENGT